MRMRALVRKASDLARREINMRFIFLVIRRMNRLQRFLRLLSRFSFSAAVSRRFPRDVFSSFSSPSSSPSSFCPARPAISRSIAILASPCMLLSASLRAPSSAGLQTMRHSLCSALRVHLKRLAARTKRLAATTHAISTCPRTSLSSHSAHHRCAGSHAYSGMQTAQYGPVWPGAHWASVALLPPRHAAATGHGRMYRASACCL